MMEKEYIEFLKDKGWKIHNLENDQIKIEKDSNVITLDYEEWDALISIINSAIDKFND